MNQNHLVKILGLKVLLNHKSQHKFKNNLHLKNSQEEINKKILLLQDQIYKEIPKKKKKRKLKDSQRKKMIMFLQEAVKLLKKKKMQKMSQIENSVNRVLRKLKQKDHQSRNQRTLDSQEVDKKHKLIKILPVQQR